MRNKKKAPAAPLDFEVNIVPIIDCMTILIIFMLASGVFMQIGMLDVGLASDSGSTSTPADQKATLKVSLEVLTDHSFNLVLEGEGAPQNRKIAALNSAWDYVALEKQLGELKTQHSDLKTVTVVGHPEITYLDVVKAMEVTKRSVDEVLLGGF